MSRPKRQQADDADHGPMVITMLSQASTQLADVALIKAVVAMQDCLHDLSFSDNLVINAGELPGWGQLMAGLEALIRDAWADDAAQTEAQMRDEGMDPEAVAGLKVPHGVVPS